MRPSLNYTIFLAMCSLYHDVVRFNGNQSKVVYKISHVMWVMDTGSGLAIPLWILKCSVSSPRQLGPAT